MELMTPPLAHRGHGLVSVHALGYRRLGLGDLPPPDRPEQCHRLPGRGPYPDELLCRPGQRQILAGRSALSRS